MAGSPTWKSGNSVSRPEVQIGTSSPLGPGRSSTEKALGGPIGVGGQITDFAKAVFWPGFR